MSPGHGNSAWAATIRGEILGGKTTSAPAAHAITAELPDIQKRSVAAGTQKFPDVAHSLTKADIVAKLMFNASGIDIGQPNGRATLRQQSGCRKAQTCCRCCAGDQRNFSIEIHGKPCAPFPKKRPR